jgi:hypothetical protein
MPELRHIGHSSTCSHTHRCLESLDGEEAAHWLLCALQGDEPLDGVWQEPSSSGSAGEMKAKYI